MAASMRQHHHSVAVRLKVLVFVSALAFTDVLQARGVVIRTGDNSFIGSIAGLAGQTSNAKSSLEIEVEHVVRFIAILGLLIGIIAAVIGALLVACSDAAWHPSSTAHPTPPGSQCEQLHMVALLSVPE